MGGVGNRLLLYLHVCASALSNNNSEVTIINDQEICDLFNLTIKQNINDLTIKFEKWPTLKWKITQKIYSYAISLKSGKEQDTVKLHNNIEKKKKTFICTYYFRDVDALLREQDNLRRIFVWPENVRTKANELIECFRSMGKTVVAVHMRKGDYRNWRGGVFYYTDEEYLARMNTIASNNPMIHFHLVSNEPVDIEYFSKLIVNQATVSTSSGSISDDLAVLSCSDYIMGPQSTFSAIAAFLGNKPLYFFERDRIDVSLSAFSWERYFTELFNGKKQVK